MMGGIRQHHEVGHIKAPGQAKLQHALFAVTRPSERFTCNYQEEALKTTALSLAGFIGWYVSLGRVDGRC